MGYWNMTITGAGAHDNPNYPTDADNLFREFVEKLQASGQQVDHAMFTAGGRHDVLMEQQRARAKAKKETEGK